MTSSIRSLSAVAVATALMVLAAVVSSSSSEAAEAEQQGGLRVDVVAGPTDCDPSDRISAGRYVTLHYIGTIHDLPPSSEAVSDADTESDGDEDWDEIVVGTVFETTLDSPDSPLGFYAGTGSMIQGWERGLEGLCAGSNATLVVPPELAYGDRGLPDDEDGMGGGGVPPGATLRFDVSILSVDDGPPPGGEDGGEGGGEGRGGEEEPDAFSQFDADGDGRLNREEVEAFFKAVGADVVPPELWENEDRDGDGYISWHEFGGPKGRAPPSTSTSKSTPSSSTSSSSSSSPAKREEDELPQDYGTEEDFGLPDEDEEEDEEPPKREEFDAIDTDGDGLLSADEVEEFFAHSGLEGGAPPPNFWADEDANGDGYISPEEFGLPPPPPPPPTPRDAEEEEEDAEGESTTTTDPRKEFDKIDADGDGRISPEEVDAFFRDRGGATPEGFWDREDTDGDGYISFREFVAAAPSTAAEEEEDDAEDNTMDPEREFEKIDTDGDGRLSQMEVDAFFRAQSDGEEEGAPEWFWDEEDADGDGYISLEEFVGGETTPEEEDDEEVGFFDEFDADGDGRLSREEVREFFRSMGERVVPEELWEHVDADGDGYISRDEFHEGRIEEKEDDVDGMGSQSDEL